MNTLNWKTIAIVLVLAGLFRCWGTFEYKGYIGDEELLTTAAKRIVTYGVGDWRNPPLHGFILAGTMKMFGDTPVGWRIGGILFGTASILLLYRIARQLYPESPVPLLAASLMAFDPFDIHFCRTTMIEPAAIFFFLSFLYFMITYSETGRNRLTSAGIAIGLAIATKAYFVFAIAAVICYALYRQYHRDRQNWPMTCVEIAFKLILLPLSIYLLSYILWFARGHTLQEFFQFRYDASWIINHNFKFFYDEMLAKGGSPWEWFITPISFGHQLFFDGQNGRYTLEINNPLFRLLVIPSICIVVYHAVQQRQIKEMLAPLLFATCYLLFFLVNRRVNSYSALVLLPFAYLCLAHAVTLLARKYRCETEVTIIFLGVVFVSGCYLFPISSGFLVPVSLYEPVLSISDVTRVF